LERLPGVMADLVRRRVAVVVASSDPVALAAKAATSTIPIVFGVGQYPVDLGLVASLARPGGNATGVNFFFQELVSKRLALLHEMVPKATHIAVLVNPANATSSETTLRNLQQAARALGLHIHVANASTSDQIDVAFESFKTDHAEALFVAPDTFLAGRAGQLATLAARERMPAIYLKSDDVVRGGLMSYGTDIVDSYHQMGVYTGNILHGAKPADLPVVQSTKFVFAINMATAKALGIEVPPTLLALADEVIE